MPEPATTFGVAATIAILYQLNKSSRDPNMAIQRALFSLAPDGEEEVRAAKQAAENAAAALYKERVEANKQRKAIARKRRDLTEWEHMEVQAQDGAVVLRGVDSQAPKGMFFSESMFLGDGKRKGMFRESMTVGGGEGKVKEGGQVKENAVGEAKQGRKQGMKVTSGGDGEDSEEEWTVLY